MRLHRPALALSLVLGGLPLVAQSSITVLQGSSGSSVDVLVFDESRPAAPPQVLLRDVTLESFDLTNRTLQRELRSDVPRPRVRDGVPFVELAHNGRLLRFEQSDRRDEAAEVEARIGSPRTERRDEGEDPLQRHGGRDDHRGKHPRLRRQRADPFPPTAERVV